MEIAFELGTADPNVARGSGFEVFGPTPGKAYVRTPDNGAAIRTASFSSREAGTYVVQVYSFVPAPAPFTLKASRPLSGGRIVAVDPGHGGPEIGAVSPEGDLLEKNVNLKIALKLAALLRSDGDAVTLTRDADRPVKPDYTNPGKPGATEADLQARIDAANAAGAQLFVSIHNNGGPRSESGTEVWYNRGRPFSDRNATMARLLQDSLLREIRALGYPTRDRGVKDDSRFRVTRWGSYNIMVLGPSTRLQPHAPTQMPGVLGESLFVSNPGDSGMLRQEATLDAIARAYRNAVRAYFQAYPG